MLKYAINKDYLLANEALDDFYEQEQRISALPNAEKLEILKRKEEERRKRMMREARLNMRPDRGLGFNKESGKE